MYMSVYWLRTDLACTYVYDTVLQFFVGDNRPQTYGYSEVRPDKIKLIDNDEHHI